MSDDGAGLWDPDDDGAVSFELSERFGDIMENGGPDNAADDEYIVDELRSVLDRGGF